jgi:hypothetical protein
VRDVTWRMKLGHAGMGRAIYRDMTLTETPMIEINIYRAGGQWYGSRTIDGEFDGCDELSCDGDASEDEARACAENEPLTAAGPRIVRRVEDQD